MKKLIARFIKMIKTEKTKELGDSNWSRASDITKKERQEIMEDARNKLKEEWRGDYAGDSGKHEFDKDDESQKKVV